MLRIITFATQKGGAGKTTLATSFAVAATEAGETVVLFDLDFQQSVMAWREAPQQPKSASNPNSVRVPNRPIVEPYPADKLPMMSRMLKSLEGKGVTLVVLDTPGAANATVDATLAASDFVVIPLAPTRIDLGAVRPTVQAVMRTSSKFGFVLNNCSPQLNNPRPEKMATGLSTIGPVARPNRPAGRIPGRLCGREGRHRMGAGQPRRPGSPSAPAMGQRTNKGSVS